MPKLNILILGALAAFALTSMPASAARQGGGGGGPVFSGPNCPAGYYGTPTSGCTAAQYGYYVPNNSTAQIMAPAGSYAPGRGNTQPTLASTGYYVPIAGRWVQTPAPAGSYVPGAGASSYLPAPSGFYAPTTGLSSTSLCPTGSASYGGASACRAVTSAGVSAGMVSPVGAVDHTATTQVFFGTLPFFNFGNVQIGETATLNIVLRNITTDRAVGQGLTDLTLLSTASYFNTNEFVLANFVPGTVLSKGSFLAMQLSFSPVALGTQSMVLNFLTDQNANFGQAGNTISMFASGVGIAAPVPEPETYAMMLAGLGMMGLVVRRRRFG